MRLVLLLLLCAACKPRCEVVQDTILADGDITELGSVESYLGAVETETVLAGTWWDGRPLELTVEVARGEGEARYVEYDARGGEWSPFGREMSVRVCSNVLSVPLDVVVRSDDNAFFLEASVAGEILSEGPSDPWMVLPIEVPYTAALAPDGDVDPATAHSKTIWANLTYDPEAGELTHVTAGWRGMEDVDGTKHDAHRSVRVLEAGEDPSGQPPASEPE